MSISISSISLKTESQPTKKSLKENLLDKSIPTTKIISLKRLPTFLIQKMKNLHLKSNQETVNQTVQLIKSLKLLNQYLVMSHLLNLPKSSLKIQSLNVIYMDNKYSLIIIALNVPFTCCVHNV